VTEAVRAGNWKFWGASNRREKPGSPSSTRKKKQSGARPQDGREPQRGKKVVRNLKKKAHSRGSNWEKVGLAMKTQKKHTRGKKKIKLRTR